MNNLLEYKGYTGNIQYSKKDNSLQGRLLGIKAVITYEGTSVDEVKADFREAVDIYLDYCKSEGITPEKPFNGLFNVSVSSEMHKQLACLAAEKNQTLNSLIEDALDSFLSSRSARSDSNAETSKN